MIEQTLRNDPKKFPHQIRCAASLVILLCREGLWPVRISNDEIVELAALARRQLTQIKQMFSAESRAKPEVANTEEFRLLMKTLDEEIRCLDARGSDVPLNIPNEPPSGWGAFWDAKKS
ncbi:MAG: hypothetical protein R3C03_03410 [Pirellulaceae bacterium]